MNCVTNVVNRRMLCSLTKTVLNNHTSSDMMNAAEIPEPGSSYNRRFRSDIGSCKTCGIMLITQSSRGSCGKFTSAAGFGFWFACIFHGRIVLSRLLNLRDHDDTRFRDQVKSLLFAQEMKWFWNPAPLLWLRILHLVITEEFNAKTIKSIVQITEPVINLILNSIKLVHWVQKPFLPQIRSQKKS